MLGFYFYFCMSFENEFTFVSYLNKVFILAKHSVFISLLLCGFILFLIISLIFNSRNCVIFRIFVQNLHF